MPSQAAANDTMTIPNHQSLKAKFEKLLAGNDSFQGLHFRKGCAWTPLTLTMHAILWLIIYQTTLTEQFETASDAVNAGDENAPRRSFQAFIKMLRRWTTSLVFELTLIFQNRMQTDLSDQFTSHGGWQVFGTDSTCLGLPLTKSNQAAFCAPKKPTAKKHKKRKKAKSGRQTKAKRSKPSKTERDNKQKKKKAKRKRRQTRADRKKAENPQMRATVLFHLALGLVWQWRLGPSNSSEREHLLEMIGSLPKLALIVADAGFVGYEFWKAVMESGRHLVVRVGANVKLLSKLGYNERKGNLVYLWPGEQQKNGNAPLVLRLVVINTGRETMYLVTTVLDVEKLSDQEVAKIYSERWLVEVFFRNFKQTYGKTKLLSRDSENATIEATWALVGLWAISLDAAIELSYDGIPAKRISVAQVLKAYRYVMRNLKENEKPGKSLSDRLAVALIGNYASKNKTNRDYPRQKKKKALGAPRIVEATIEQIQAAKIIANQSDLRLTA